MSNFFTGTTPLGILVSVLILVLIFLIIRELLTWYWKINEIVLLLREIRDNTSGPGGNRDTTPSKKITSSESLQQPFDGRVAATIFGLIFLVSGIGLLLAQEYLWSTTTIFVAAVLLLLSRNKRSKEP